MSGIIFCACSTLAIPFLQIVLKWCQEERKKNQVKKESQRSQDQWWVWLQGLPQLCHLLHQKARWREVLKVKVLWVCKLRNMIERENPLFAVTRHAPSHHQRFVESSHSATYSGWDDDKAWSSQEWKADELMNDRTVKPLFALGQQLSRFTHLSLVNTSTSFWKKMKITIERWNP